MKIGVCANYDRWGIIAAAGYDYVEGNFSKIARATEEEFEEMKEALAASGIKMEATNGFFPGDFQLYSKDNFEEIKKNVREYCERGFAFELSIIKLFSKSVSNKCSCSSALPIFLFPLSISRFRNASTEQKTFTT